jgi:hypothetical protein
MLTLNSLQSCAVQAQNPVRKSCWEIKSLRPDAPSGTYQITGPDGKPLSVTCDMSGQGGGWTLAAVAMFTNRGQGGALASALHSLTRFLVVCSCSLPPVAIFSYHFPLRLERRGLAEPGKLRQPVLALAHAF